MSRDIQFKETITKLSQKLPTVKYNNEDLSDIGNEVGFCLGSILKDMTEEDIRDFIMGFRHGVSLTNGTHYGDEEDISDWDVTLNDGLDDLEWNEEKE